MKKLNFKNFMNKYKLRNDTMNESELHRVFHYPIYPRGSKLFSDKVYVIIDDGRMGRSHWVCFIVEHNKSFYYDSFGGRPGKCLLNQLPKPILYHNFKIQDIYSRLCGSYC